MSLTTVFGMGTGGSSSLKALINGDPYGIRTHEAGVRGQSLNRLTNGPYMVRHQGLEPGTR